MKRRVVMYVFWMGHGIGRWTGLHSVKIPLSLGISHKGTVAPSPIFEQMWFLLPQLIKNSSSLTSDT